MVFTIKLLVPVWFFYVFFLFNIIKVTWGRFSVNCVIILNKGWQRVEQFTIKISSYKN